MKMPVVGECVEVEFLDHDQGEDHVDIMVTYGRVAIVTDKEIVVDSWHPREEMEETRSKQRSSNSLDASAIVRKAIIEWWYLDRR
jgi:hypothetical protein